MRQFLSLTFLVIGLCSLMNAQDKARIVYEETFTFQIPEEFKARMPKDMQTTFENGKELVINGKQSYYKEIPKPEEPAGPGGGNDRNRWMRRMGGSEEIFNDLSTGTQLSKANTFGKEFIVKDEPSKMKWRIIATEQREILGYTCMKAEYRDSTVTTVWFTPQIPLSFGPNGFSGLPGLILAASVGENKVLLAKTIDLKPETADIKPIDPKNAMPREEFTKMVKEKGEEMRKMFSGRRPSGQ